MKVILTTLNAKYTHTSLALRYLRGCCRDFCDAEIMEFTINNQLLDILGQIYEKRPDVIGIVCYIWNIEMVKQLVKIFHRVLPDCRIVCGGPEVSYNTASFMQNFPMVDYVVRGEGEEAFAQLLQKLQSGHQITDIRGIAYREESGEICEGEAVTIGDLDTIVFPYEKMEMSEIKDRILYYETSRGCPFACKYCLSCATKGVRYFSIERVLKELAFFVKQDVRQVKFVDRTFNADKAHFVPIIDFIAKQDCRTNFHFEVAIDYMDDEVLAALKCMPKGRVQLEIGIQSTNKETLQAVSRVNHWDKISANIKQILSFHNIHLHVDLIIGLPNEDKLSFSKSFNDVYELKPDMLQLGFLKFLKGAAIMKIVKEHEYVFMDMAPYQVLANKYMSYGEIRWFHSFEDVFERYYNAGRFRKTIAYLIRTGEAGNAFVFYQRFTNYWENQGYHKVAHTTKALYGYLLDYCRDTYAEQTIAVEELLKLDALISERGGVHPERLHWNMTKYQPETARFWRDSGAEKYIKAYTFTNWRELRRQYHIEVFSMDVLALIGGDVLVQKIMKKTAVLFDFRAENVKCQVIEQGDLLNDI